METDADLLLAHQLVDLADEISLRHFGREPLSRHKADGSPVSEADLAVEKAVLAVLAAQRPGDAVLSEESGALSASARRWIIDPIDGTIPFLEGRRDWGTHVALEIDGELRIGILSRPTEGMRWWARSGAGAFASSSAQPLSTTNRLGIPRFAVPLDRARVGGFLFPGSPFETVRDRMLWVDSSVCLVADLLEGRVAGIVDEGGNVWDRAPAALLVREAGGEVDDLHGGGRIDRPWLVYTADGLARELVDLVREVTG
ncbi:inositol monophosphatase family protein [Streptomyces sparsogenes]|uniref:Glucose-1-phosphate thymidylyltransferase n=1 Tax=Streptomyces sparsogenes DSM 40356 TaxID=1331668 RepID=A0A1R1SFF8_9ACTN|nr:inositol monophosphatase family protein [Streptomyces sparsogenes]OMI36993.1 glucose-1-phosphate thymidylyltransferase [Streptomyces sparsogenes DSM 40356]